MLGIEDRENGGMASSMWNTHETTWGGMELVSEDIVSSTVINSSSNQSVSGFVSGRGRLRTTTTTNTTSNDVLQTFEQSGVEKDSVFSIFI